MISGNDVARKCVKMLQESFESIGKIETVNDATAVINYAYGMVDLAEELIEEEGKIYGRANNRNGADYGGGTVLPGNDDQLRKDGKA